MQGSAPAPRRPLFRSALLSELGEELDVHVMGREAMTGRRPNPWPLSILVERGRGRGAGG